MSCGPGRGLGVALEAEGRPVGARQALQRAVEQADTCVGRRLAGSVFSSTAKPWFWLVMLTRPVSRSFTGWLAPWWPNFILKVLAPEASAMIWWPRQMPKVGMPRVDQLARGGDGVVAGLRVAGAVADRKMPSGFSASTSAAGVCAGTTVTRQPRLASMRRMLRLTPKS